MKIKEMQKICDNAQKKYGCISCPLRIKANSGCLKNYKYEVVEKYKKYKEEKNEVMAEKIMNEYLQEENKLKV